jgi:hypothetical protein
MSRSDMPSYRAPGVYIEEVERGAKPIEGVGTSTAGFLGPTERGAVKPQQVTSFAEYERLYGGYKLYKPGEPLAGTYLAYAVDGFFANGGTECYVGRVVADGTDTAELRLLPADAVSTDGTPTTDTSRLDFGTVPATTEDTLTVILTNPAASAGGKNIPFEEITYSAAAGRSDVADAFSVTDNQGSRTVFAPDETLDVTVTAKRTDGPRERRDTLRISLGNGRSVDVELVADFPEEGNADHTLGTEALVVEMKNDPVRFGDDPVTVDIPIENLTDAAIPKDDVSVALDGTDGYEVTSELSGDIPAPGSQTVTVSFTPPASEDEVITDTLRVSHPASTEQFAVDLRATLASNFTVDKTKLDIAKGATEQLQITNTDDAPVPADEVELTLAGRDADDFTHDAITTEIADGGDVTIDVSLPIDDRVPRKAELHITRIVPVGSSRLRLPPVVVTLNGNPNEDYPDSAVVKAAGPGKWGEQVAVFITEGSLSTDELPRFTVTLRYWAERSTYRMAMNGGADPEREGVPRPDREEVYENLSADPSSSDYYVNTLNSASTLVTVEEVSTLIPAHIVAPTWLTGSFGPDSETEISVSDYVGKVTDTGRTGLQAFEAVDEIAIVCIPDERQTSIPGNSDPGTGLTNELVEHCTSLKDRFAVLQSPLSPDLSQEPPIDSKYAAFYYPWVRVVNPETNSFVYVPPGGHICGIYARSDTERGVHKAPANEPVRQVADLYDQVTQTEQASLNPRGINCIRSFPGRGIRVWGARTTTSDPSWKYVNVRRLFIFLEESIDEATQWVVFEPNNQELWARVRQSVSNFLTTVWRTGALMGSTPDEAFFVKCDRTTMSQDDIDNGRLIIEIGVAVTKPAEFVIFRISQVANAAEGA